MMMEDRPVIRAKEYTNRATGLQNFKQIRTSPKNLWKKAIVDKALELRREGREITDGARQFILDEEEDDIWSGLLENEEEISDFDEDFDLEALD
jgi:hypothetical protein